MFQTHLCRASIAITAALLLASSNVFAGPSDRTFRLVLTPDADQELLIVPPGMPAGGGFTSTLTTLKKSRETGTFTTDIVSGELIFDVLGQLLSTGQAVSVDAVNGTFETDFGTIFDTHQPTIIPLNEPPTKYANGIVMVAVADGEITGGTRLFRRAKGRTTLYLKFEVNPATFEALVRTGTFMFEFE